MPYTFITYIILWNSFSNTNSFKFECFAAGNNKKSNYIRLSFSNTKSLKFECFAAGNNKKSNYITATLT